MPVKTPVKKTKKPAQKKSIKKTAKKETWDDIEANFARMQKSQDEAWVAIREAQQAVKDTQKNIGGLNNSLGSIAENVMTPALPEKFKPLGFTFDRISRVKWTTNGNVYAEIDGLLENGTQAMAVEVKTTLEVEDVNEHIKRMERIRKYADEHGDKREFLAAMAAMVIKPKPKNYALNNGIFIIEPSGDDVKVTKPEKEPRIW